MIRDGSFVELVLARHFFAVLGELQGVYEFLYVAVEDVIQVIYGQADAMVGDAALWEIVSPDLGAAVACAHQAFPVAGNFFLLFAHLFLI